MPTIRLQFPGGRYHATPWGHHVNEGLIEWPPSPWRLLRAFIASGFSSQGWVEIPPIARQLIEKLASSLPSYHLPLASVAHSRHFMPIGTLDKGREKTTLVFDTWANIGNETMTVHWPCQLTDDENGMLRGLVKSLGYLGRSESWIEAEVIEDPANWQPNAFPHQEGMHSVRGHEQISLMAAIQPNQYRSWQQQQANAALAPFPLPEGKKKPPASLLKNREYAVAPYPTDLVSCLTKDTAWWKAHRWSQPPGSQRVLYWRPSDSLQVCVPQIPRKPISTCFTTMLLAITTRSGRKSALPPISRTLPQAELLHRQLVGRVGKGSRVCCPELTGRDDDGNPLRNGHQHAHILPVDLDGDGKLDHFIIHAKMGLRDPAQQAIRTLKHTWTKGNPEELQLAVAASGGIEDIQHLTGPLHRQIRQLLGPTNGGRIWESVTPFVPPRFIKRAGRNTLHGQIEAELASRGLKIVNCEVDARLTCELRQFVRRRNHGGVPPFSDVGFGVRLTLATSEPGPITLGYGAHFGLGMFRVVDAV